MGMDVFGKQPRSKTGEYFRNSIWWWHPLADYILENSPQELTSKCRYWHSNDGDGLDDEDSKKLADHLQQLIDSGHTAASAGRYGRCFSVDNVQEFADFLRDCGGFEIC